MDHLELLREKIGHLRDEIAHLQELNDQYRRAGSRDRNETEAQIAHGQRHEATSCPAGTGPNRGPWPTSSIRGTDEGTAPLTLVSRKKGLLAFQASANKRPSSRGASHQGKNLPTPTFGIIRREYVSDGFGLCSDRVGWGFQSKEYAEKEVGRRTSSWTCDGASLSFHARLSWQCHQANGQRAYAHAAGGSPIGAQINFLYYLRIQPFLMSGGGFLYFNQPMFGATSRICCQQEDEHQQQRNQLSVSRWHVSWNTGWQAWWDAAYCLCTLVEGVRSQLFRPEIQSSLRTNPVGFESEQGIESEHLRGIP
jgi:hypothetical protein